MTKRDRFHLLFAFLVGAAFYIIYAAARDHGWPGGITALGISSLTLGLLWLAYQHRTRNLTK